MVSKQIKEYYKLLKTKKVDNILIIAGIVGVIIGLLTTPIINQVCAWFVLIGLSIKLYDFTEEIERNIIPYDYNKLLPPPPKKKY